MRAGFRWPRHATAAASMRAARASPITTPRSDQIIGQRLVDVQLAGGIIDAGHAGAFFIGEDPLRPQRQASPSPRRCSLAGAGTWRCSCRSTLGHGGHGDWVLRRGRSCVCSRYDFRQLYPSLGFPLHEWDQWVCPVATGDRALARCWSGFLRHHQRQPGQRKSRSGCQSTAVQMGTAPSSSRIS